MHEMIEAQLPEQFTFNKPYAIVLEYKGKPKPFFVTRKTLRRVYHLNTLTTIVGNGLREPAQIQYRLQANGKIVDDGYAIITQEEKEAWIQKHKDGIQNARNSEAH